MRTFSILILFFIFQLDLKAQNTAKFKFETEVLDYGTIDYNSNGFREFKFTNVGKEPLTISNVNSSCGCLVPEWPKEPIRPGGFAKIKARYDTKRIGAFEKTLTIISNADRPTVILKIKGVVVATKKDSTEYVIPK